MKRILLIGTLMMLLINTPASAWIDFFGKNKERKINFANQVISEILTPEEMSPKERFEESSKADGNHTTIVELISGEYPNFKALLYYDLNLLFREKTHEQHLNFCKTASKGALEKNFRLRKKKLESYRFRIISEDPKDIISISEGYDNETENTFGVIGISRDLKVGKWSLSIAYYCIASELTKQKKEAIIERLKTAPSINSWILKSKKSEA